MKSVVSELHLPEAIEYAKKRRLERATCGQVAKELNEKFGDRVYTSHTVAGMTARHFPEILDMNLISLPGPVEFLPEGCRPAYL